MKPNNNTTVVLLAGGQGTRIRSLYPDVPKAFIPFAGRPFVEWVVDYFRGQGLSRFAISLGHLAEVAEATVRKRVADGTEITTVREPRPMGTGGALLHAVRSIPPCDVVVCANADSLVLADLAPVWQSLQDPGCDGVIVGVNVDDTSRYGSLKRRRDGTLKSFREKTPGRGVINAGVYAFKTGVLNEFPMACPLSMEKDVFPHLLKLGLRFFVHATSSPFLDIGTPKSICRAGQFIQQHMSTAVNS